MTAQQIIENFNREHGYTYADVLFVRLLRQGELSDNQIATVIEALGDICHHCWDALDGCQCSNDE